MIDNIKKILRKGDKSLIFNENGRLVELNKEEFAVFEKYGALERFPETENIEPGERKILEMLCDLNLVQYPNYKPKEAKKKFSKKLLLANSAEPILDAPILAHMAITTKCNMRCKYCSVREAHHREEIDELTTEQWKHIIKKLSDAGVFQIGFTGGEPTLRKDIHELMRFTENIGCVCNLTTNAWLLTEDFVKEMAKTGIKQCQVSLDSFNEEIHDRLRGKGSCKRVLKAIRLLHKHGIHVGIDCVISTNNIKDIPNLIEKCEELGVEYVTLIKLKKGDLDEETFRELVPTYEEYGRVIEKLCYRKNTMPNVTIDCASISNLQYTLRENEVETIPTAGCPIGHNQICVAPNGDLYPCAALMEERFKLGNILTGDFRRLWKENELLKKFRNIKKLVKGKCAKCERLDFCRAGCRGIAYTLAGGIFESDISCDYSHSRKPNRIITGPIIFTL